jgi:DNA-binding CsgD family transcriptional regulator
VAVTEQLKSAENGGGSGIGEAARHRSAQEVAAGLVEHFLRRAAKGDPSPKILIDEDCNILWRSDDAERLLQPPLPLSIKGGRLNATSASGGRGWISFIDGLGEENGRLLLTGPGATTWVLVTGCAERHEGHRLIFLKCAMSWPFRDVASSGLSEDFGLTRSESAVLDKFAQLKKPVQIAEELEISVSTVRSHLKQIHAKMAVNSGVQLLRITRAYCDT